MKKTILKNTLLLSALCVGVADSVCGGEVEYSANDGHASAQDAVCLKDSDGQLVKSYKDLIAMSAVSKIEGNARGNLLDLFTQLFRPIWKCIGIGTGEADVDNYFRDLWQNNAASLKGVEYAKYKLLYDAAFHSDACVPDELTGFLDSYIFDVKETLRWIFYCNVIKRNDKDIEWLDGFMMDVPPYAVEIVKRVFDFVQLLPDIEGRCACSNECECGRCDQCLEAQEVSKKNAEICLKEVEKLFITCILIANDKESKNEKGFQEMAHSFSAVRELCIALDSKLGQKGIDDVFWEFHDTVDLTTIPATWCVQTLVAGGCYGILADKMKSTSGAEVVTYDEDVEKHIVPHQVTTEDEARKVLSYFCDFMCLAALWEERCSINPDRVALLRELFEEAVNGNDVVKNYKRKSDKEASMSDEVLQAFKAVLALMRKGYDCSEDESSAASSEDESSAALSAGGEGSSTNRSVSKKTLTEVLYNNKVRLSTKGVKEYIHDLAELLSNHFDVLHNTNAEKQLIADAKEILTGHALSLVYRDVCSLKKRMLPELQSLDMRGLSALRDDVNRNMCMLLQLLEDVNRIKESIYPQGDKNVPRFYEEMPSVISACIKTQLHASNVIRIQQYIGSKLIDDKGSKEVNDSVIETYATVISGKILSTADDILRTLLDLKDVDVSAFKSKVEEWKLWADTLVREKSASNVNTLLNLFDQSNIFMKGCDLCFVANKFMNAHSELNALYGARQEVTKDKRAADGLQKANALHQKVLGFLSEFGTIKLERQYNSEENARAMASMEVCCKDVDGVWDEMQALLATFSGDVNSQITEADGRVHDPLMLNISPSHTISVSAEAKDDSISDTIEPQPGIEQSVAQFEAIPGSTKAPGESIVMANNEPANDHNGPTEIVATLELEASDGKKEEPRKAQAKPGSAPQSVQKGIATWTKKKHVMVWGSVALTLICFMIAPFCIGGSSIAMIVFVAMGGTGSVSAILSSVFVK